MFCVIQQVEIKKVNRGEAKRIEVYESSFSINGENRTYYKYRYSDERFERPVKKAFKISIHESYREQRKVKKRQTVICTVGYYSIIDWGSWIGDYVIGGLGSKAEILGITEEELTEMIYKKFQPIADQVIAEFEKTEECKARKQHREILNQHNKRIDDFKEKYDVGSDEYDRCYDVFGELRNPEYLKKIEENFKARKEYERRSREQSSSCYEEFYSNHWGHGSSSYCGTFSSNHSKADKAMLKKFYRTLSKAYHPDSNPDKDTSEEMKMLNNLKNEWGL